MPTEQERSDGDVHNLCTAMINTQLTCHLRFAANFRQMKSVDAGQEGARTTEVCLLARRPKRVELRLALQPAKGWSQDSENGLWRAFIDGLRVAVGSGCQSVPQPDFSASDWLEVIGSTTIYARIAHARLGAYWGVEATSSVFVF